MGKKIITFCDSGAVESKLKGFKVEGLLRINARVILVSEEGFVLIVILACVHVFRWGWCGYPKISRH